MIHVKATNKRATAVAGVFVVGALCSGCGVHGTMVRPAALSASPHRATFSTEGGGFFSTANSLKLGPYEAGELDRQSTYVNQRSSRVTDQTERRTRRAEQFYSFRFGPSGAMSMVGKCRVLAVAHVAETSLGRSSLSQTQQGETLQCELLDAQGNTVANLRMGMGERSQGGFFQLGPVKYNVHAVFRTEGKPFPYGVPVGYVMRRGDTPVFAFQLRGDKGAWFMEDPKGKMGVPLTGLAGSLTFHRSIKGSNP